MPDKSPKLVRRRLRDLRAAETIDYAAMPPRRRPKMVGLVGWICAGVGYGSFIVKGSTLPALLGMDMKWLNPDWKPLPLSRGQFIVTAALVFAEMLVGLICMIGGIGALKLREWGRRTLIGYAMFSIVVTLLKSAWTTWMFEFMLDYQISMTTQPVNRVSVGHGEYAALIVATLAQLMWPLIVVSIVTRRYVRDAFDAARLGDGANSGWRSDAT